MIDFMNINDLVDKRPDAEFGRISENVAFGAGAADSTLGSWVEIDRTDSDFHINRIGTTVGFIHL